MKKCGLCHELVPEHTLSMLDIDCDICEKCVKEQDEYIESKLPVNP